MNRPTTGPRGAPRAGVLAAACGLLALPLLGPPPAAADVLPGTCTAVPPLSGCPVTTITASPPAATADPTAAFAFSWSSTAVLPDTSATFQCRLAGPGQADTFADCATQPASGQTSGAQQYVGLAPGDYTFTVHATGALGPGSDATYAWSVAEPASEPGTDGGAPQTRFRHRPGTYLRDDFFELRFAADRPVSGYRCSLDGRVRACAGGSALLRGIGRGTHRFSVAAVGATGTVDPTPATARFTLPVDSTRLGHYSRGWRRLQARGCFLDTYSVTSRKGAWVSQSIRDATRVDLVVSKDPGYGSVRVFLGKRLLRTVSLAAPTHRRLRFVRIAAWRTRHSGVIRIVSTGPEPVVIEGLGVVGRPRG